MSCGRNDVITSVSVASENLSEGCCEGKRLDAVVLAG